MTAPAAAIATHDANGKPVRRYPIPDPDTGEVVELPNISSIIDVLQAWGLTDWKLRMAAVGLVSSVDLAARVAVAVPMPGGRDRNAQILDAVEDAIDLGQRLDPDRRFLANDFGSAIHLVTEHVDAGLVEDVMALPTSIAEHAAEYVRVMTEAGVADVVESEFTVWSALGYAGTGDRALRFDHQVATIAPDQWDLYDLGRGSFAVDVKTGGRKESAAMQLAALANADSIYDAITGTHRPLPADLRRDVGFILQLHKHEPATGSPTRCRFCRQAMTSPSYGLFPVDLAAAWPAFQGALAVQRFCETKPIAPVLVASVERNARPADDTPPKVVDLMQALSDSIDAAKADRAEKRAAENAEASDLLEAMGETPTGVPAADAYEPGCEHGRRESVDCPECDAEPVHVSETLKLAIAAIPDDPTAGTITDDGHVLPDLAARTAWLAGRLAELIDTHGDNLPLAWPDGVPSFKANREAAVLHTAEQLEQIDRAITDVENELRHPWPNPDPGIVANQRVAADDPRVIDITERFAALPPDIRDDVGAAAAAAGVKRFSMGSGTEQCVATWQRLLDQAEPEATKLRDRITNAAGVLAEAGVDGDWLLVIVGNLNVATFWQADRLDELADAYGLDYFAISYDADGELQLTAAGKAHLEREFGGKTGVRKAARMTADQWGIEPPAKADDVYANPLLAAALCMSESETTAVAS
jgi:hypothetical protein